MLPAVVKIGAIPYRVTTDDHERANWGLIEHAKQTITISTQLGDHAAAQTLMHEIMHGIEVNLEGNGGDHDDAKIQRLGNAILMVLVDNPDLCRMVEALRPV